MSEMFPELPSGPERPAWLRFDLLLEATDRFVEQENPAYHMGLLEEMGVDRRLKCYGGPAVKIAFSAARETEQMPKAENPLDSMQTWQRYRLAYQEADAIDDYPEELIAAADSKGIALPVCGEGVRYRYTFDLTYHSLIKGAFWDERRNYSLPDTSARRVIGVTIDRGSSNRQWLESLDTGMGLPASASGEQVNYMQEPVFKRLGQGFLLLKALEMPSRVLTWEGARPVAGY